MTESERRMLVTRKYSTSNANIHIAYSTASITARHDTVIIPPIPHSQTLSNPLLSRRSTYNTKLTCTPLSLPSRQCHTSHEKQYYNRYFTKENAFQTGYILPNHPKHRPQCRVNAALKPKPQCCKNGPIAPLLKPKLFLSQMRTNGRLF